MNIYYTKVSGNSTADLNEQYIQSGGRGRGKQIASEASVAQAQASVAQVESPAPAEVVQLRRGRSKQTQQ